MVKYTQKEISEIAVKYKDADPETKYVMETLADILYGGNVDKSKGWIEITRYTPTHAVVYKIPVGPQCDPNDIRAFPINKLTYCPSCGIVWARIKFKYANQWTNDVRNCHTCGGTGSLIRVHSVFMDIDNLPPDLLKYEFSEVNQNGKDKWMFKDY